MMRVDLRVSSPPARRRRRLFAALALTGAVALGTAAAAQPRTPAGDAGVHPSPLNPAPNEFPDAGPPADTVDYDHLLEEIASLRARAAVVGDALFHSRIAVSLRALGDHARVAAVSVGLDGGAVWSARAPFRADDPVTVYEHAVAPGRHGITLDIDRSDDRDDAFRTSQRSRFTVDVPQDMRVAVQIDLTDDSDMGGGFEAKRRGEYDLRARVQVRAQPLGAAR